MTKTSIPQRLQRLALLLEDKGIQKLSNAHVLVLGLGGVGSSCVEALARGGIGHLSLLDGDTVEESNINRQAIAFTSTVGRAKTEVMREMVLAINPDCDVDTRKQFLTRENTADVLDSFAKPDVVLDCIDTVSQKLEIAEWSANRQIPLLSAMGAANKRDPMALRFAYVEKTFNCPLSKVMRRECRKRGLSQVEIIFSTETPIIPRSSFVTDLPMAKQVSSLTETSGSTPSSQTSIPCACEMRPTKADTLGSMSYMPPIMGQMMAGKVICRLAGLEKMPNPPKKRPREAHRDERKPLPTAESARRLMTQDPSFPVDGGCLKTTPYLLDTHAHWDFLPANSRYSVVRHLREENIHLVAQTVLPSSYWALKHEREEAEKAGSDVYCMPILSLGFHPWWVATPEKNQKELAFFADALSETRFIGEVGLDFSEKRLMNAPVEEQRNVLRNIFRLVRKEALHHAVPYVFSLHAVRALTPLLDLYEEEHLVLPNVFPIVHRFAGTSDDLTRLIRIGGLLSVHPAMLETKRGRAYIKQIPADRLLLETDLPTKPTSEEEPFLVQVKESLNGTITRLSSLRGEDMAAVMQNTQNTLYGFAEEQKPYTR